ncbi:MAG TPA: hypothetical protein VNO70_15040 [Blastocatellia bacterium]|nr:hypothetical protein [Blastocatellia bacterium]
MIGEIELPDDFPDYLKHSDEDAPVPTWEQVTRCVASPNPEMTAHLLRIVADTDDEEVGRNAWLSWPRNYRRSVALLVDKIYYEGWLDAVGPIKGWPWDGGFFFFPRETERGALADVLDSKSGRGGTYTACSIRHGLFAYLNAWNHKGWQQAWMETDAGMAALHVGIFADGSAEVHLEAFNPLYVRGAARSDLIRIPLIGSYNHRLFLLHRRWEQSAYAPVVRTSANFYHMMREDVPLCF